jgi:D-hexose-6-phosphate mutarotase
MNEIVSENFIDLVVWNPWVEKAKAMADFDDEEYKQMICLEVGKLGSAVSLAPAQSWSGSQTLSVLPSNI